MPAPASSSGSTGPNLKHLRELVASGVDVTALLQRDGRSLAHPTWAADEIEHLNYSVARSGGADDGPRHIINPNATAAPPNVWSPPGPKCPFGMTVSDGERKTEKIVRL
jgi:hypothetical protein